MTPALEDPVAETRRLVAAADEAGLALRAIGGVAVAIRAPSIALLRPTRTFHDIDLAGPADAPAISRLLIASGYEPALRFNTLNGSERLLFHDPGGRRLDVFIDTIRMCHPLRFADRLRIDRLTLPAADLLLSKLQIVELTPRDLQDVTALLADVSLAERDSDGISLPRVRTVCGDDWGWWRTVTDNLTRLAAHLGAPGGTRTEAETQLRAVAQARANVLLAAVDTAPRSLRWRARALVGPRLRWYDLPEEIR
jgi:hypothetical protein